MAVREGCCELRIGLRLRSKGPPPGTPSTQERASATGRHRYRSQSAAPALAGYRNFEVGQRSLKISAPKLDVLDYAVLPPRALQVRRRGSVGERQEHHFNPFDEPMKARVRPNRLAYFVLRACIPLLCALTPCSAPPAVRIPCGRLAAGIRAVGCPTTASYRGAAVGHFLDTPQVRSCPQSLELVLALP